MIVYITGKLRQRYHSSVVLDVAGLSYEIFVPVAIMTDIDKAVRDDGVISLITYHYYQIDNTRSIPILIGFLTEIERDFFIRFTTVSGVGPKAAIKALSMPIPMIARAIDDGNKAFLKSLPGIGEQKARDIIAKLQGKVGKYALMPEGSAVPTAPLTGSADEALAVLLQLEYKKAEAQVMIHKALEHNPQLTTAEDILNEVYKQKAHTAVA